MRISVIAAIGEKNELGSKNQLLWNIPEDLQHFKKITSGHPVIMGRKTFESIGKILPNRINIVISRDTRYSLPGAIVVHSLDQAIAVAQENEKDEIFIIGGEQLFNSSFAKINRLYLTIVHEVFPQADVYFPDYSQFNKVIEKRDSSSEKYQFTFVTLEK